MFQSSQQEVPEVLASFESTCEGAGYQNDDPNE